MIRLAHLSDIHFGAENPAAAEGAAAHLGEVRPDAVIVSGDLTRFGEPRELEAAAAWLERLPHPRLTAPGNHDAPYLRFAERLVRPFRGYERIIGPADGLTLTAPGLAAYGLNSARGAQLRLNWSKGQVSTEQAAAAAAFLAGADPGALKVLVCHHPLLEMIGGPMTARVWGGARAARQVAEAGADLVLSGHIHAPFVWPYPYGDGRTYAAGAGTLSLRERGTPAGFNLIEADAAEIRVQALAWTGRVFETLRTWSVDRRPISSPDRA